MAIEIEEILRDKMPPAAQVVAEAAENAAIVVTDDPRIGQAKALLGEIRDALASKSRNGAEKGEKALAMLKALGTTGGSEALSQLVNSGLGQEGELKQLWQTEESDIGTATPGLLAEESIFSRQEVQMSILDRAPPGSRRFFEEEFKGDTVKVADIRVETINGKRVVTVGETETLKTDKAKESFTRTTFHGLDEKDRKEICAKHGIKDTMTPKDVEEAREAFKDMKKLKVQKIMDGPGTKEEKDVQLDSLEQRFEKLEERLKQAERAEIASKVKPALGGIFGAAMGAALDQNNKQARDAFQKDAKAAMEKVVEEPGGKGQKQQIGKGHEQGHDVGNNSAPLPTGNAQGGGMVMGGR